MSFVGRYINMDASTERRAAMEAQFERIGQTERQYTRFSGVDGRMLDGARSRLSAGELGCFMSHYRCIAESDEPGRHVHIVEDDVVFAPQTAAMLEQVIGDAAPSCDILFTDIFVPLEMTTLYSLMKAYRLTELVEKRLEPPLSRLPRYVMYPDISGNPFGGATSYVVNHASREKIVALLDEQIAAGPNLPIDMVFRILANAGRLKALCTIPFLTTIESDSINDSTIIGRRQDSDSAMAFYALRNFFYVARDDAQLMGLMRAMNGRLADPDYLGPMLEVFRFALSERFVVF